MEADNLEAALSVLDEYMANGSQKYFWNFSQDGFFGLKMSHISAESRKW